MRVDPVRRTLPPGSRSSAPHPAAVLLVFASISFLLPACDRRPDRGTIAALHLADVTASTGIALTLTSGRTPSTQILEVKGGGLALLDIDEDGDVDLFAPNGATLADPLRGAGAHTFENLGGLKFADASGRLGPDFKRWGFGPAVGDVDGDGHDDIYVSCFGTNALYRALGGGKFDDHTDASGTGGGDAWSMAAAFGDVDGDGDLDLYVANYLRFDPAHPPRRTDFLGVDVFGGPHGLPPEADRLFENQGDGTFRDITDASGCGAVKPGYGLGVAIVDFDGDGSAEIFVGNDSGENFLFHREADGRLVDRGVQSGIASNQDGVDQATMGIAIGDVNGDLLPDVFTTNFMNDTNTLHVNAGNLLFEDQTQPWGLGLVSRPFLAWATAFVDFDHDADEDVVVFNGHVYPEETARQMGSSHAQTPQLFVRDGARSRFDVASDGAGPWLTARHCDRSAVFGDLDLDGDIDIIVGELNGPLRVLENDGAQAAWLIVRLIDARPTAKNRLGLGARVVVSAAGRRQVRWIHGAGGYQAANPPWAHFGFGSLDAPVEVEVTWPDGERQELRGIALRQHLDVRRN